MVSAEITTEAFEHAVMVMFKPPALQFSRSLRTHMDKDPEYLKCHEAEVLPQLKRLLREAGVLFDEGDAIGQMRHVIREVVIRLRSYEKGKE